MQQKKEKRKKPIVKIAGAIIGVLAVVLLWKAFSGDFDQAASEATNGAYGKGNAEIEETDYITMIQTGYLGEFEDATVKDILDMNFGLSGFSLDWISGDMDGQKYVAFYAYPEGGEMDSGTTLLFQVCSDNTFKISGYAEGENEDFERAELADFLNNWYMNWYIKNKIGQDAAENEMMEGMQTLIHNQFDRISGSAVLYGASKDYSGDRKNLSKDIDGTEPLDMSVTELINLYNDNMLDIYTVGVDEQQNGEAEENNTAGNEAYEIIPGYTYESDQSNEDIGDFRLYMNLTFNDDDSISVFGWGYENEMLSDNCFVEETVRWLESDEYTNVYESDDGDFYLYESMEGGYYTAMSNYNYFTGDFYQVSE